ncbi:putative Dolichol-phosphate mannosyltransferase [Blattamonas nauphoetae]|uniref:Dolichol-phosphate mannosyltransferase subunit 1 n=1 Tax=Blattamonas nauphoetae TaxID=2049346 RepID=A0ABQ9XKC1_9EUKA|nr:putative Dolichol-phosphate mannosyltransferase [Blattamonas nauphoetae]
MSSIKYSILLPTYNERENLPIVSKLLVDAMTKTNETYEIIVIDDSSPDGTSEVAKRLQTVFPGKIILKQRTGKLGLGSAYIFGEKEARGEFVIILDCDLSHHPKIIPQMIAIQKEKNCDIVTGTRYEKGGGVCGWNWKRKFTSAGANTLASVAVGHACSDMTGSFRLYRRSALKDILPKVKSMGFSFQLEIILRAQKMGFTIEEVPIIFVDRVFGQTKINFKEYYAMIVTLIQLMFEL